MSKVARARVFIPIYKVDVEQRLVYGRVTEEVVDKAQEVLDYATSKPYFEAWSGGISKATDGKSVGNVRAMHQPIAAGKLTDLSFDDAAKAIDCCAKIVDDGEWNKVLEGVYTGFSMGGQYVKRWTDPANAAIKRYTANPSEVSLVDNPCVPTAQFTMIKADGVAEEHAFKVWAPTNDEIAAEAAVLKATDAGKDLETAALFDLARDTLVAKRADDAMGPAEDEEADPGVEKNDTATGAGTETGEPAEKTVDAVDWGVDQVFRTKVDGQTFAKKADALAHVAALKAVATSQSPVAAALAKALAAGQGAVVDAGPHALQTLVADLTKWGDAVAEGDELVQKHAGDDLQKRSLYTVGRLAELMQSLRGCITSGDYYCESPGTIDDSKVTDQMVSGFKTLGGALIDMAKEQVAAALTMLNTKGVKTGKATKADEPDVGLKLAAVADDAAVVEKIAGLGDLTKLAPEGDFAKLAAENAVLKAQIDEALPGIATLGETVAKLTGDLGAAQKRIEELAALPAPMPAIEPGTGVAGKSVDGPGPVATAMTKAEAGGVLKTLVEQMGPDAVRDLLFSAAISQPMQFAATA